MIAAHQNEAMARQAKLKPVSEYLKASSPRGVSFDDGEMLALALDRVERRHRAAEKVNALRAPKTGVG